jgi:hypothetical protein
LIAAVRAADTDECDVCCITWGKDERSWDPADVAAFNNAAKAAVDNGMIIVAASGDNDSSLIRPRSTIRPIDSLLIISLIL